MADKQDVISTGKRCKAKTKAGEPCRGFAVSGAGYCFTHDPDRAEERRVARAKGGHARHGRTVGATEKGAMVTVHSIGDLLPLVQQAVNDVLILENSIARARSLGYLIGVAVKVFEVSDLAQRVSALEEFLHEQNAVKN